MTRTFNTESLAHDFTPGGVELVQPYENDRNQIYEALFEDIISEVYGAHKVICGHHLVYQTQETLIDPVTGPYVHTFTQELPSADWAVFDHEIAKKIWGEDRYLDCLAALAREPAATRNEKLAEMYYGRTPK